MAPEFTKAELHTICMWAMNAADKARTSLSYWPEPYEMAQSIFNKANDEYRKREG